MLGFHAIGAYPLGGFKPYIYVNASGGIFTLTGGSVDLYATRVSEAGLFDLAGQTVLLKQEYDPLVAEGTTYALTGQASQRAFGLNAARGSFVVLGQVAGLRAARTISAGQGAFTLAGQDARTKVSYRLRASARESEDTTVAYLLFAPLGAVPLGGIIGDQYEPTFRLTGYPVGLHQAHRLAAQCGTYALTGQDAALRKALGLAAAGGVYTLTGLPAALRQFHRLIGETGYYTLAGQPAVFVYYDPAEFMASARIARRMAPDIIIARWSAPDHIARRTDRPLEARRYRP